MKGCFIVITQSSMTSGMISRASAYICAIRSLRMSGGGTENSCCTPFSSTFISRSVAASATRYQMKL